MFLPRTLKLFAAIVSVFFLLSLPALVWPAYLDSPAGLMVAVPYLSIYLFHQVGIPGLLENNGLCGWGWCAPTAFGWGFLATFWLLIVWIFAWGLSSLGRRQ
ncbi:MAG: hypothetical protein PHV02_18700 [Rhodocyclaceae bacterium]|nr:hypothetical protein [Rhodocyclaceae bacterium]